MKQPKTNPTQTILTICVGFLVIHLITKADWAIYVSLVIGVLGVFSPFLSKKIDFLWMKLAWVLSLIIPNILLSIIFYLFLFPIALLSKLFSDKDPLMLKNTTKTTFRTREKSFEKSSFEKPW